MAKRMLIDASHPEEMRVAVLSGKRLEEFDYETAAKKPLKGNIYLAKITRVEPSLQAAFVDYGGNRHGFLPFTEIHPDYYRIPIADREALIAEEAALKGDSEDEQEPVPADTTEPAAKADVEGAELEQVDEEIDVDTVGGDEIEEDRRKRAKLLRRYKIQEVIKRRQVILVQVSKEERGNKGAALTTYLSLAGRYCVLMPNTARGGGISRKIGNANDRRRLKSIVSDLKIPEGMAVIVRTAGSQRSKAEVKRDYEYLLRLWDEIRQSTLKSTAPSLIYEEGDLIKRSIRDLYTREMEEILIEGEDSYKTAKAFMKTLMPSHARNVKLYKDPAIPLLQRHQVESQIEAVHNPIVELASGGYIVISPTEALVSIDINSGRATKERHIETTALKTNLEAADEIARQLRLRDLAGLIVIDFIDMEEPRHNREVERRLKEAMRHDRARIQLGRISHFGLLEMSRQRLRPSLIEASSVVCARCKGTGHIRSSDSAALQVLRVIEEQGIRRGKANLSVTVHPDVALYLFNQMRRRLNDIEQRYELQVTIKTDSSLVPPEHRLEVSSETGETIEVREEASEVGDSNRKRRRRPRRGKESTPEPARSEASAQEETPERQEAKADSGEEEGKSRRRRRGKRGGRRRSRRRTELETEVSASGSGDQEEATVDAAAAEATDAEGATASDQVPSEATGSAAGPSEEIATEELGKATAPPARKAGSEEAESGSEAAKSETEEVEKKPAKRSRRSRPKKSEEAKATEVEKPKRRARRSRKKPTDSSDDKATAAASEEGSAETSSGKAEPKNVEKQEKIEAPQPPTAAVAVASALQEAPPPPPSGNGDLAPVASTSIAKEPKAAQAGSDASPQQPGEEDKPKRRGWWNKLGS